MAANKEALVIILDVGAYMNKGASDESSPLDIAKECIGRIIQRKIFAESKDELALVLYGTSETKNDLAQIADGEYSNITVVQGLLQANFDLIKTLESTKGTNIAADFIDALVVGMGILVEQSKGQKFASLRLLLFTNFGGNAFDDQIENIISGMKNAKVELTVVGPQQLEDDDDDDAEEMFNEKNLTDFRHKSAKSLVKKILDAVNGEYYTFSVAMPALTYFQRKPVTSAAWNVMLEIGENLQIPITACTKITAWKPKSWKTAHAVDPEIEIIRDRTFHLNDDNQTEVEQSDLIQGYRYGTTMVPYTKDDEETMKYKSGERGMKIVGFTKEVHVKRHYYMGDKTMYVVGRKDDEPSQMAIAGLIQALYETSSVAIVRYVYAANSPPRMGFLAPRIKPSYKAMFFIQLPYVEDVRHYPFASLTAKKSNIPSDEQLAAVDNLITAMDLSMANDDLLCCSDDEENDLEALKPSNNVNPCLERLYQCLYHRVFHPGEPLPPIPQHILDMIEPPSKLVKLSKPFLDAIKKAFPLEPVIKKKSAEIGANVFQHGGTDDEPPAKRAKPEDTPSGMTDVLLGPVSEIGTVTPVEDFKKIITQEGVKFNDACKQLENTILQLIRNPRGGLLFNKAVDCLKVYREEALKKDPILFNNFVKEIKTLAVKQYSSFWEMMMQSKVSLIYSSENQKSHVSFQESADFLSAGNIESADVKEEVEEDADDLLDMM